MAAFVGAFALFATPAEAGGRRHYKNHYNGCVIGVVTATIARTIAAIAAMGTIARCVTIDPHITTRVLISDRHFPSASPLVAAATAVKPRENSVGGMKAPERTDSGAF